VDLRGHKAYANLKTTLESITEWNKKVDSSLQKMVPCTFDSRSMKWISTETSSIATETSSIATETPSIPAEIPSRHHTVDHSVNDVQQKSWSEDIKILKMLLSEGANLPVMAEDQMFQLVSWIWRLKVRNAFQQRSAFSRILQLDEAVKKLEQQRPNIKETKMPNSDTSHPSSSKSTISGSEEWRVLSSCVSEGCKWQNRAAHELSPKNRSSISKLQQLLSAVRRIPATFIEVSQIKRLVEQHNKWLAKVKSALTPKNGSPSTIPNIKSSPSLSHRKHVIHKSHAPSLTVLKDLLDEGTSLNLAIPELAEISSLIRTGKKNT